MNLPNYFLADLPPEALITPAMLSEACQTLRRNRASYLAELSTASICALLASLAAKWLDPQFPFRKLALEKGPALLRFSASTLAKGLDRFFRRLTPATLKELIEQDLGHPARLEQISACPTEEKGGRASVTIAPELLVHICAGNLPPPTLHSMVLGVLTRSAQIVKCAHGASLIPRLFAHSMYQSHPKLGACLEVAEWRGGNEQLESVLFEMADCVTATGKDETLAAIRKRVPSKTRFLGYGQKVSFAYISASALTGPAVTRVVAHAADDVVAWDQQGCLSPHVIYVENGGNVPPELFAERLGQELAAREVSEPRGALSVAESATIASRRSFYEVRATHSRETRVWQSLNSTAWTVVYEHDPQFQMSCLNRFIYVKSVKDLTHALHAAERIRETVSTVGLATVEEKEQELVSRLAAWGVRRICPLGSMQDPPFAWRHDGRPPLGDLVLWTDWEMTT